MLFNRAFGLVFCYLVCGSLVRVDGKTVLCRTDFDDVATRTMLATVVFEGRADKIATSGTTGGKATTLPPGVSSRPTGDATYNVTFRVKKPYKGDMERKDNTTEEYVSVLVGPFAATSDSKSCVGAVNLSASYVVFAMAAVNGSADPRARNSSRKTPAYYRISSLPQPVTSQVLKDVKENSCVKKCGKVATVQLVKPEATIKVGDRLQLQCQVWGKPTPRVYWYKDGAVITSNKVIQLKDSGRSSRLRVNKAREEDTGIYSCSAANYLGSSTNSSVQVVISTNGINVTKPHADQCPAQAQNYCLNGGTCFVLSSLGTRFCECREYFQGDRCQEKHTGIVQRLLEGVPEQSSLDSVLAITGVAIGVAILLVLCILVCVLIRTRHCGRYEQKTPQNSLEAPHPAPASNGPVTMRQHFRDRSVQTDVTCGMSRVTSFYHNHTGDRQPSSADIGRLSRGPSQTRQSIGSAGRRRLKGTSGTEETLPDVAVFQNNHVCTVDVEPQPTFVPALLSSSTESSLVEIHDNRRRIGHSSLLKNASKRHQAKSDDDRMTSSGEDSQTGRKLNGSSADDVCDGVLRDGGKLRSWNNNAAESRAGVDSTPLNIEPRNSTFADSQLRDAARDSAGYPSNRVNTSDRRRRRLGNSDVFMNANDTDRNNNPPIINGDVLTAGYNPDISVTTPRGTVKNDVVDASSHAGMDYCNSANSLLQPASGRIVNDDELREEDAEKMPMLRRSLYDSDPDATVV